MTPRVMGREREIKDVEWSVAGLARAEAQVCTQVDGGPAYGGTPSDQSVIAAIQDLKSRGLEVTIYPLMMMDIPSDNALPNPYENGSFQPPYPWRGRITCDPAIGQLSSADQTATSRIQIDQFVGVCTASDFSVASSNPAYSGPNEWSYRRFILHTANVARAAGGVNAFIIGSEMVSLSTVRDQANAFPFVDHLKSIASDAKGILGEDCKLTYAADWTEYHGYQPPSAPGDKFFHVDPLWADVNIDAVGIDNYMPLADWRDLGENADFANHDIIHEIDYLKANIAAGEGFDWFYASAEDRVNQVRTPITDGAHNEPWVWRYKDLFGWWSNAHYNRVNGLRSPTPTDWVPEQSPIWLTELGCAAVGLGANEPNAFPDPKSIENRSPYFSAGNQEPSNQRQFLRAHYDHWQSEALAFDESKNPSSSISGQRVLDAERTYLWAWDARPFPAFPLRDDVWSDSGSHATGHWTTGRFGCATAAEFVQDIANESGAVFSGADASSSFIEGTVVGAPTSVRENVELLLETDELIALDRPEGLRVARVKPNTAFELDLEQLCVGDGEALDRNHRDRTEDLKRLNVSYHDRLIDYDRTSTFLTTDAQVGGVGDIGLPMAISQPSAARVAKKQLALRHHSQKTIRFSLPLSYLHLEVGDTIRLPNDTTIYKITSIRDDLKRAVEAVSLAIEIGNEVQHVQSARAPERTSPPGSDLLNAVASVPSSTLGSGVDIYAAAYGKPWSGLVTFKSSVGAFQLQQESEIGLLTTALPAMRTGARWDGGTEMQVHLLNGHLSSAEPAQVLAGANRILIESDDGNWEELGFANAELIGARAYRLTHLLRGQGSTEAAATGASVGAKVLVKSSPTWTSEAPIHHVEMWTQHDPIVTDIVTSGSIAALLPLAPVHLSSRRTVLPDGVRLSWKSRARSDGNDWRYGDLQRDLDFAGFMVRIFDGATMVRELKTTDPELVYESAMRFADFGAPDHPFAFEVAQISSIHGPGHFARGDHS